MPLQTAPIKEQFKAFLSSLPAAIGMESAPVITGLTTLASLLAPRPESNLKDSSGKPVDLQNAAIFKRGWIEDTGKSFDVTRLGLGYTHENFLNFMRNLTYEDAMRRGFVRYGLENNKGYASFNSNAKLKNIESAVKDILKNSSDETHSLELLNLNGTKPFKYFEFDKVNYPKILKDVGYEIAKLK